MAAPEPAAVEVPVAAPEPAQDLLSEEEAAQRVHLALSEAKRNWDMHALERDKERSATLNKALTAVAAERVAYLKRVEREVVQLSLAITRKILHREANLDPTLLSGLVRIALDRLGADSPIRVRVPPDAASDWAPVSGLSAPANAYEIVADATLSSGDCLVETTLGTANFGIEAQLKEIERSFLDLLAQRPDPQ